MTGKPPPDPPPPDGQQPAGAASLSDDLERMVLECLAAPRDERDRRIEELCHQHPDYAGAIRARVDDFERADQNVVNPSPADSPGYIGPYRILDTLGEGGMGTVYQAEQKEPVRRLVAIKVIKFGMDSKDVLARFELERRALAAMNHSSIAKVFEAGATDRGQPYFVMELVEGLPLTAYCDKHRLTLKERIELYQQLCSGVQHAHQKGIVHRDLKPANVLVVREGGKAVPKILDFGLAKATNRDLLAKTIYTEKERILGTPEYMAPEQATFDEEAIDTRADIYSLGVILYELLSGELPFSSQELRKAGRLEIQRVLAEVEPSKPSTRVSTSAERAAESAQKRRTNLKALARELRGDLDWIVLKALSKEPERRYGSTNELALDLQRHLDHEPVLAGPPSAMYRLRKQMRRYRGQVVAGALVFVTLVAGIVGTTIEMVRADENATRLQQRTSEFDMLALVERLRVVRAKEQDLYPAWPEQAPLMRAWLDERGEGVGRLRQGQPQVRATLAALRSRSPTTTEEREVSRRRHPRYGELEKLREALVASRATLEATAEAGAATRDRLQREAEALEAELTDWRLPVESDRFLHDTLTRFARDLDGFLATEAEGVKRRLRWAEQVQDLTIHRFAPQWETARADILRADDVVASALYGEDRHPAHPIDLQPQTGLVPIGRNPKTLLWEFYHLRSAWDPASSMDPAEIPIPTHREDGSIEVTGDSGIVFVLLPGGTFTMGAQSSNPDGTNHDRAARPDETPDVVSLAPFFLARHELTQGQWKRLLNGDEPSSFPAGSRNFMGGTISASHPVEQIDWTSCHRWLTRHGLLLPTEAQWEYGCRADTDTPWWTGEDRESLVRAGIAANLADQTAKKAGETFAGIADWPKLEDGFVVHAPVDALRPNWWGLYHVHGNVWEWCRDWYGSYDKPVAPGDGLRQVDGSTSRVARGGGYSNTARTARSGYRNDSAPTFRYNRLGARPARALH